jgi:hypothetical protein
MLVEDLTPDHVRLYIANLSDGPNEGEEHRRMVIHHYAVIHEWVRWICAQKFLTRRDYGLDEPLSLRTLFPVPASTKRLAVCC